MPKVYLTENQRENELIKRNLILLQGGLSCTQMGKIIGISKSTYLNRLKNPQQLTLREITKICNHFKIPIETFLSETISYK